MSDESSSKSMYGGMAFLLIVVSLGLKFLEAYNKHTKDNPPAPVYAPPPPPPPVVHQPLPLPAGKAPVIEESLLDLEGWSLTTFESGRFRLYTPPDPEVTDAPKNKEGKTPEPGRRWQWNLAEANLMLLVEHRDQSEIAPLAQLFTTDSLLDSMVTGYIKNGKTVSRRAISLRGSPGREARWETEAGRYMVLRLFLRGTDRYLLLASADVDHIDDKAVEAFFDSFDFAGSK